MPINYDENGYKILDIPAEGNFAGKFLPNLMVYVYSLNKTSHATSCINKFGCHTDLDRFAGQYIETDKDTFGVVLGHEFNPFIYRGENNDYEHFIPSAIRYDFSNENERVRHCINYIKKQEFIQVFQETPYYQRCEKFRVLNCKFKFDFEAIAQHYEFISNYLDITKDLTVAMFFAYTYQENGKYYPITDFEKYHPTLYVGNLKNIFSHNADDIRIIGFQSLYRPFLQKAMAIEIKKEDTIKPLFEKIILPANKAIAYEIYSRMRGGNSLFPNDYASIMAKDIKESKFLYREYFEIYCKEHNINNDEFYKKIEKQGYCLSDQKWGIYDYAKYIINKELDDNIIPFLDNCIALRGYSKPK